MKRSQVAGKESARCRWFSPQTLDGNQSPWKQHKSADRIKPLANTRTHGGCAYTFTRA